MTSGVIFTVANIIASFVGYPVYLHYLGLETYGLWLMLSVVLQFSRIGILGIPEAITKLVAEESKRDNARDLERCITTALFIVCASGVLVVFGVTLFRQQLVGLLNVGLATAALALWYLPLIALLSLYIFVVELVNAVLSGLGRMDQANYIRSAGRLVMPPVSIALLAMGLGLKSLLIGNAVGYCVVHLTSIVCVRRLETIHFIRARNWDARWAARILRFGGGVTGMSLVNMFLSPFNKLMLTRYVGLEVVPIYEIGYRLSMQLRALFQMFFRALLPEFSRESAKRTSKAFKRIWHLNRHALRLILTCALPGYATLMIVATPLLQVWLGQGYVEPMSGVLRIFLLATFLSLLCVPSYYTLLGLGRVSLCLLSSLIQSGVNVAIVLGFILTRSVFSVYSVAFAVLVGMAMTSMFLIVQARRSIRVLEEQLDTPEVLEATASLG